LPKNARARKLFYEIIYANDMSAPDLENNINIMRNKESNENT